MKIKDLFCISMLLSVVFFANIYATVQPIFPGENLWKILSRLGITSDIIEDKVCDIVPCCDFTIKQDDIPFTITAPGVYCLAENVYVTLSDAITINSDCVVLDLLGHAIEGGNGSGIGILIDVLNTFTPANVIVKNGVIKETVDDGIKVDTTGPIKISNMKLTDAGGAGVNILSGSEQVILDNCISFSNNFGFVAAGDFCVFRNCIASNNRIDGFQISGRHNCFIECKANNNAEKGFLSFIKDFHVFISCIAQNNDVGFLLGNNQSLAFNCIVQNNAEAGFEVAGFKHLVRSCVAVNNEIGFEICDCGGDSQLIGCSSVCNSEVGITDENITVTSLVQNNLAHDNGENYDGVGDIESVVTSTTGFWANISG